MWIFAKNRIKLKNRIKFNRIKKHCLRLVLDDYESDYGKLIKKNCTTTMEIKKLQILVSEVFKNKQYQPFINEGYFHS